MEINLILILILKAVINRAQELFLNVFTSTRKLKKENDSDSEFGSDVKGLFQNISTFNQKLPAPLRLLLQRPLVAEVPLDYAS